MDFLYFQENLKLKWNSVEYFELVEFAVKIEFTVIISIVVVNFGVGYEIALRTNALHYELL